MLLIAGKIVGGDWAANVYLKNLNPGIDIVWEVTPGLTPKALERVEAFMKKHELPIIPQDVTLKEFRKSMMDEIGSAGYSYDGVFNFWAQLAKDVIKEKSQYLEVKNFDPRFILSLSEDKRLFIQNNPDNYDPDSIARVYVLDYTGKLVSEKYVPLKEVGINIETHVKPKGISLPCFKITGAAEIHVCKPMKVEKQNLTEADLETLGLHDDPKKMLDWEYINTINDNLKTGRRGAKKVKSTAEMHALMQENERVAKLYAKGLDEDGCPMDLPEKIDIVYTDNGNTKYCKTLHDIPQIEFSRIDEATVDLDSTRVGRSSANIWLKVLNKVRYSIAQGHELKEFVEKWKDIKSEDANTYDDTHIRGKWMIWYYLFSHKCTWRMFTDAFTFHRNHHWSIK